MQADTGENNPKSGTANFGHRNARGLIHEMGVYVRYRLVSKPLRALLEKHEMLFDIHIAVGINGNCNFASPAKLVGALQHTGNIVSTIFRTDDLDLTAIPNSAIKYEFLYATSKSLAELAEFVGVAESSIIPVSKETLLNLHDKEAHTNA